MCETMSKHICLTLQFRHKYVPEPTKRYTQCPSGREVPQGDCLAAANVVTEGWTNIKNRDELLIDDWNFTPCGCFVYNNQMIDYDAN